MTAASVIVGNGESGQIVDVPDPGDCEVDRVHPGLGVGIGHRRATSRRRRHRCSARKACGYGHGRQVLRLPPSVAS